MYAPDMDPSDRYRFRAPTERDFDAVVAVLLAEQRADDVEPTIDAHFLRQVWSRPGFDLAADAWVGIDAEGTVVAYGQIGRGDGDVVGSWGAVHPEHRGRGIGSALLDRIEARASDDAGRRPVTTVSPIDLCRRSRGRGDARGPRPATDPPLLAHADRPRWTGRARAGARRHRDRGHRATRRPPGGPRDRRSRLRRRPGREHRAVRSMGGGAHDRPRPTTRRSGSWRGTGASRSAPSPRAPVTMSAGSTIWRSSARIGDAASDRPSCDGHSRRSPTAGSGA